MSHGQIRTPVAIKLLNSFDLAANKDVVACPSLSTRSIKNTGHRIKYAKFDAVTGEEVSNDDITKGYKVDTDIRDNWLSNRSSESWEPQQRPHPGHRCAGGGAVHSIDFGSGTGIIKSLRRRAPSCRGFD
jgi:hypothetical protein